MSDVYSRQFGLSLYSRKSGGSDRGIADEEAAAAGIKAVSYIDTLGFLLTLLSVQHCDASNMETVLRRVGELLIEFGGEASARLEQLEEARQRLIGLIPGEGGAQ